MLSFGGQVAANPAGLGFLMLWIVGVSNAFNLLDNMDGLAGGVGLVSSITVAFLFFSPAAPERLILILLAGALLGFLPHNFSPARVYLGDSGSHAIGFTVATLPLYSDGLTGTDWRFGVALLFVVLVPIADTSFVIVRRTLNRRPMYLGGKDHSSHWLLSQGLTERQVALFYAASLACSLIASTLFRSSG